MSKTKDSVPQAKEDPIAYKTVAATNNVVKPERSNQEDRRTRVLQAIERRLKQDKLLEDVSDQDDDVSNCC